MKRIPPIALSHILFTIFGVSPIYFPTNVARLTSTTLPVGNISILCNISPILRAIVVLPVPGLPVSIKLSDICCIRPTPCTDRCFINILCTAKRRIISLTERIPINSSSSLSTSSNGRIVSSDCCGISAISIMYISDSLKYGLPISPTRRRLCLSIVSSKTRRTSRALPKFLSRRKYNLSNIRFTASATSEPTMNFPDSAIFMKISVSSSAV